MQVGLNVQASLRSVLADKKYKLGPLSKRLVTKAITTDYRYLAFKLQDVHSAYAERKLTIIEATRTLEAIEAALPPKLRGVIAISKNWLRTY